MARKKKYRLYAMKADAEGIAAAQKERFARITPDYVLVYAKRVHKEWAEITDGNIRVLTEKDKQWLQDCNVAIIGAEAANERAGLISEMSVKIAVLEKALVKEKELITNGGDKRSE